MNILFFADTDKVNVKVSSSLLEFIVRMYEYELFKIVEIYIFISKTSAWRRLEDEYYVKGYRNFTLMTGLLFLELF